MLSRHTRLQREETIMLDYGSIQFVLLVALTLWIFFFCADTMIFFIGSLKRALTDGTDPLAADWEVEKGSGTRELDEEDIDDTDYPMG